MAKAIMIQGTMSNAGKSLLAAGLCRIFCQDGYRVAPFKSQNMALNSFITREGLEMGRAQVVQAQAAKVSPSVDMNPILLKPSSDTGSQVIVSGVPVATMAARDYFRYKKSLVPSIMEAYGRLDRKYDIIVIEGAGSPAEINLKSDDIVNMGMARMAKAPVLLAGDIDRGGVFAQLYGTVMLLEPEERKMVKGLIINKFRGDKSILDPGVEMIEDLCRIPVVGVTPYMDVDIEDEDSLSSRLTAIFPGERQEHGAFADIAVIRFPRLSNFTDFHVLSAMKGASVRYVSRSSELGRPASPMRCSMRFTGRISPDRPISPAMHTSGSMAVSMLLERIELMTARSIAGSFTFNPPAILRNTSFCASLKPTRFSNTASSIFMRRMSNPVAERCGLPYTALLTNACVSMRNGLMPSIAEAMAMPLIPSWSWLSSSSDGLLTCRNPSCRIS